MKRFGSFTILVALVLLFVTPLVGTAAYSLIWSAGRNNGVITIRTAAFEQSATGVVVPAVSGKKIKVFAVKLVSSDDISVKWRDGFTTDIEGAQPYATNGGYVETIQPDAYLFSTSSGTSLQLVISAGTGTASGRISYWSDDSY